MGDCLQFLSNGFLKSSIHCVVTSPLDQAHLDRLGILYFVRPGSDVNLDGADSPVLRREGLLGRENFLRGLTAKEWISKRLVVNISNELIEVEKEELNNVGEA